MQETQEPQVQSLGQEESWRRKWLPTPVFLPRESRGPRSLAGCSPRGHKQLDITELLSAMGHTPTRRSARTGIWVRLGGSMSSGSLRGFFQGAAGFWTGSPVPRAPRMTQMGVAQSLCPEGCPLRRVHSECTAQGREEQKERRRQLSDDRQSKKVEGEGGGGAGERQEDRGRPCNMMAPICQAPAPPTSKGRPGGSVPRPQSSPYPTCQPPPAQLPGARDWAMWVSP